jgi:hypothetical protein
LLNDGRVVNVRVKSTYNNFGLKNPPTLEIYDKQGGRIKIRYGEEYEV